MRPDTSTDRSERVLDAFAPSVKYVGPGGKTCRHAVKHRLVLKTRHATEAFGAALAQAARLASVAVGFCCFVFNEEKERGTYLHNLYVLQEYRRRGVAKSLLSHAIGAFDSERQKSPVHLLVFAENTNAVAFYEKLDGTVIEKRDVVRCGNPKVELLRYQWPSAEVLLQKLYNQPSRKS